MENGSGPHDIARSPIHQWAGGGPYGGVGAAMPGQSASHLSGPPTWAKWYTKARPKAPASGPPPSGAFDGNMTGFRVGESSPEAASSSAATERTPSPIRPNPQEDAFAQSEAIAAEDGEADHPPQPSIRVTEFNSIEDMRANLVLEEKPATEKQIQYIIWFSGPKEQKFKLKKGTDGKRRRG